MKGHEIKELPEDHSPEMVKAVSEELGSELTWFEPEGSEIKLLDWIKSKIKLARLHEIEFYGVLAKDSDEVIWVIWDCKKSQMKYLGT